MLYAGKITAARIYMGYPCTGEHECVSCGLSERANYKIKKIIKPTFCNFDEISLGSGDYICESCKSIMEDKDMRFKPVFFFKAGEKQTPERGEILEIIKNPPKEFVLSVPYNFKKHHWLYAGLSNDKTAYIGTDNRTIKIDYAQNNVPHVVDTVINLIKGGVPRNEIILGKYSTFTRYRVKSIEEYEKEICGMRESGAVELFVKYTPAVTEKISLGDDVVITETENSAAFLLAEIAARSSFRSKDGLRFWQGYFEKRINRFKNLELHEFVSKLCDSIGTQCAPVWIIKEASLEEEEMIMEDIRNKTNLMVSLAYTQIKEGREKNENNN